MCIRDRCAAVTVIGEAAIVAAETFPLSSLKLIPLIIFKAGEKRRKLIERLKQNFEINFFLTSSPFFLLLQP